MKNKHRFLLTLLCICLILPLIPVSTAAKTEITENLFDFNTSYCGYYDAKGAKYYSHIYQTSAPISVNEGDVITMSPVYNSQVMYLMTLDKNGEMIERVTSVVKLENVADFEDLTHIRSYTVPAGVSYIRVTCYALEFNTFVVTKNNVFDVAAYNAYIASINNTAYSEFRMADKSAFSKYKLLWCGDSVGAGSYEWYYEGAANGGLTSKNKSTNTPSWAGRMKTVLGLSSYTNPSHGGATYSTKYPYGLNIPQQVEQYAKGGQYDIIVIEGGTVDCGGYGSIVVPLGYLSDGYELEQFAGANTFIGGIERAFYYATTLSPESIIVCVIPYSCPASKNFNNGWERLYQYIPYVCEKWGIPCVNLYKNETVNYYFDYDRSYGGLYYYDDLHCSPLGYTASSLEIAMKIFSCGKYSEQTKHMPEEIPYLITKEATEEPQFQRKYIVCEDNLFDSAKKTKEQRKPSSGNTIEYVVSDYIAVNPGDVVYFGPCSPYEVKQLEGFDAAKKGVTGGITSNNLVAFGYLNNSFIFYTYTVPENVSFVKCSFQSSKAPMITINQPFDMTFYTNALAATNRGETVDFPLTVAPVTTAEVITEAEPIITEPESFTAATESTEPEVTSDDSESTGCKASLSAALVFTACAAAYVLRRKH